MNSKEIAALGENVLSTEIAAHVTLDGGSVTVAPAAFPAWLEANNTGVTEEQVNNAHSAEVAFVASVMNTIADPVAKAFVEDKKLESVTASIPLTGHNSATVSVKRERLSNIGGNEIKTIGSTSVVFDHPSESKKSGVLGSAAKTISERCKGALTK